MQLPLPLSFASFLSQTLPLCCGGGEMAKSLRSKREKRLRTLRREIAEPFYDKKEAAKLAAQAAALEAPKVPVRAPPQSQDADSSRGRAAASSSASAMGELLLRFWFTGLVISLGRGTLLPLFFF